MIDFDAVERDLYDALGHLYQARYKVTGSEGPVDGKYYPDMDRELFDEIATLQSRLSTLISKVREKKEKT